MKLQRLVKSSSNGKYYNSGYTASMCLHPSTRDRFGKFGQTSVSYEKTLIRILDVLDMYPEIKKLVTDFDGYRRMKIE